jgi:hopanoid biosynthesis associated protein HpnK
VKKLILTADDFGLSPAVNEAVEIAHRMGVLNTASLMVGAEAAGDAVDRARSLPSLRVGLHLTLVSGKPVSPSQTLPGLVDSEGLFSPHLFRASVSFFSNPGVRRQLEREIRAQYETFLDTGLPLDHVNAHHHMHLHPTIGELALGIGREYELRAVRFPYEPVLPSWRASRTGLGRKWLSRLLLLPWLSLLKERLRRARIRSNDFLFGMNDTGRMNLDLVLRFLQFLPQGISEIYFHPAVGHGPEFDRTARNSHHQEEVAALTNPVLRQALMALDIKGTSFSDL